MIDNQVESTAGTVSDSFNHVHAYKEKRFKLLTLSHLSLQNLSPVEEGQFLAISSGLPPPRTLQDLLSTWMTNRC